MKINLFPPVRLLDIGHFLKGAIGMSLTLNYTFTILCRHQLLCSIFSLPVQGQGA